MPLGLVSKAASENIERHLPSLLQEKALHHAEISAQKRQAKAAASGSNSQNIRRAAAIEDNALPLALSKFLLQEYKLTVPVDSWALDKLPPHLNVRYSVIDDQGGEIKNSRDIGELQKELAEQSSGLHWTLIASNGKKTPHQLEFWPVPENIELMGKHGLTGYAYPALQVTDGVINLRLFADPREAAASHRQGVAALYDILFCGQAQTAEKKYRPWRRVENMGREYRQSQTNGTIHHGSR